MTEGIKTKQKTILIIEDDLFLVKTYQARFQQEGIKILVAADGKEALRFLEGRPPDLVLLDLMLPGMNGFDVLEAIRKNGPWKKIPVIVLTNLGQPQDVEKAKEMGASDYIIKANVRISDVVEKIKKIL